MHKRNPERTKAAIRRWQRTPKGRFAHLKNRSKHDKIEATLTLAEYTEFISHPCFYCGGPLADYGTGLDRINPKIGYVNGNVRPCCRRCNVAKNDMREEEFKELILRIYNRWVLNE